eukprot:283701_1
MIGNCSRLLAQGEQLRGLDLLVDGPANEVLLFGGEVVLEILHTAIPPFNDAVHLITDGPLGLGPLGHHHIYGPDVNKVSQGNGPPDRSEIVVDLIRKTGKHALTGGP